MNILEIRDLYKDFGGLRALNDLSLSIEQGQIFGLIGPNGAGKSTAFNCIAGVYPPSGGEIHFDGEKINGEKPWNLCKRGLARTFQIVKPFSDLTVLENVLVARGINHYNSLAKVWSTWRSRQDREAALSTLERVGLESLANRKAGLLPLGNLRRLEIARALATEPKLLLLDEVMAGLRPSEVDEMVAIIKQLRNRGITIFVIEHIMRAIMALSDHVVVLQFGQKIAEGAPQQVASDERVIKAYLGDEYVISAG